MGDIFICHTLYHVLIALVRALRSRPGKSTLVLSTCVPEAETLRAKLLDAAPDLWDAVLIVDEEKLDAQNSESDFYRLRHPFRKPYFTLPKGHVYISNDWSALGRYLQRERRVYTLCEDTFGGTLDPDQHLLDEQRKTRSRSNFLRDALYASRYAPPSREVVLDVPALDRVRVELNRIGVNMNQIARARNRRLSGMGMPFPSSDLTAASVRLSPMPTIAGMPMVRARMAVWLEPEP